MARAALLSRVLSRPRPADGSARSSAWWKPGARWRPGAKGKPGAKEKPSTRWRFGAGPKSAGESRRAARSKPAARREPRERRPLSSLIGRALAMACAFAFMVAFAVVLARLTLQPSPASEALTHSNLRPGDSLRAYLDQPQLRDAVKQIGGNLLLGVPFGVLVPVLAPRSRGILRVALLTAVVMLTVELAQGAMITGRAFDIDDVILNTTGALAGYLLVGRRLGRTVHARH